MILNIEEPSTSAEVQGANRLKTNMVDVVCILGTKIGKPETTALHVISGFALSTKGN
nr:unnamed protein product [Callosobruchus analis]